MKIDKVYTSYFYMIRFFDKNMVPLSTAVWDPKWYHLNQGPDTVYIDKRGVINGLRINPLHPEKDNDMCITCKRNGDPSTCEFIQRYKAQLNAIDFDSFIVALEKYLDTIARDYLKTDEQLIPVFIVHEDSKNPCSERKPLQEFFNSYGLQCTEWSRN